MKIFVCVNFLLCTSFAEQTKSRDKLNLNKVSPNLHFLLQTWIAQEKREKKVVEYFLPEFENTFILLPGFEEVFKNLLAGLEEEEDNHGGRKLYFQQKEVAGQNFFVDLTWQHWQLIFWPGELFATEETVAETEETVKQKKEQGGFVLALNSNLLQAAGRVRDPILEKL